MPKYFHNKEVQEGIREYHRSIKSDPKEIGNMRILDPFQTQFTQLVKGVINVHKLNRFHNDYDELVQEGLLALYGALKRFDPDKGIAFNYLSIVVKQHIKNWTQSKNKKDWKTGEFNESVYDNDSFSHFDEMALHETIGQVEVASHLDPLLDDISELIIKEKIQNRRDMVKCLTKRGWKKEEISDVYESLEKTFK